MPEIQFFGPSVRDAHNRWVNPQRLVNLYREMIGGRGVLKSVLGTADFAAVEGVFCRAMGVVDGVLYLSQGGNLYSVDAAGVTRLWGAVEDHRETTISGNNGKVTIAAGGHYYVLDPETGLLSYPTTGAFDAVGSVAFLGQRTILTERGGRRVQWSGLADPADFDALDYEVAETSDDDIIRAVVIGAELWVFKQASTERWYIAEDGPAVIPGAAVPVGLKSFRLIVDARAGAFFVGSDGKAYVASGGLQPVSTTAVESAIAQDDPQACVYWRDQGHEFCAITFRRRPAWVHDLSTGEWFERASLDDGPWRVDAIAQAYGKQVVGTPSDGLMTLDRRGTDGDDPLIRRAVSSVFYSGGNRFRVARLVLRATVGKFAHDDTWEPRTPVLALDEPAAEDVLAIDTPADVDVLRLDDVLPHYRTPLVDIRVSGDNGETWGQFKQVSLGQIGRHDTQVVRRALGQFRQLTVEARLSEAFDVTLGDTAVVDLA